MNIVAVKIMSDRDFREILCEVPENQTVKQDDMVVIKTEIGEKFGFCACDSFNIGNNPLSFFKMKFGIFKPLDKIVGRLNPDRWV